jgi:cardiolipin synthase
MKVLTIPNLVTFVRIVLIPIFVTALIYRRYDHALVLFVCAGISDALDGLLARITGQKSELGAFLDPLADKFLLVTSYVLFAVYGWVPLWLTVTIISRDMIIVLGWLLMYLVYRTTTVRPTILGKTAIALQLLLAIYVLLSINFTGIPGPPPWVFWFVALATIASCLHYIYRGLADADER